MPRGKRTPGNTAVTISLTEAMRDEIDAAATEENRTRSNFIIHVLAKKLAERKARLALEFGAPHASHFPSTARAPHAETLSLNEAPATHAAVAPKRASSPAQPLVSKTRRALKAMVKKEKPKS